MSAVEENKVVTQEQKEEIFKKIFQLKAQQLKEDKGLFENYQTGWFENLFEFDISCLKELEQWMDNVIEKENSPELTQLWVFQRDMIRFSYYFLTFRWIKFTKQCYFTVKAQELYADFIEYLKEDCKKFNLNWEQDSFQYFIEKIKTAFDGDVWNLVDGITKVAREFKDTSLEWFDYYSNYNARLVPKFVKFTFNHVNDVQNYLWDRFSSVLNIWMKQLNVLPLQTIDYSFVVIENFFLQNGLVRASFFEDNNRLIPLQLKQLKLHAQLGWKQLSYELGNARDVVKNTINSSLISWLSVEESEVLSLRQESICTLLKEEYPLRLEKAFNLFTLAFFRLTEDEKKYQDRSERTLKVASQIEKKLDDVFKRKDQRDARITALQNIEKKSEETIESRQKKLDEEFDKQQKTKEETFYLGSTHLIRELGSNRQIIEKTQKEVWESKRIQNKEYTRQQEQLKADKLWKEEFDRKNAKENQYDVLREIIKKVDTHTETQFQQKITKIEEENKARIEKERKEQRKAELEKFEKSYLEEEERTQLLLKQKKRIPKKKPEQIALEKQQIEELAQLRLDEKNEKIAEEERKIAEEKEQQQKQMQNIIGNYFQDKQNGIQQWVQKKGQSMNEIDLPKIIKNTVINTRNFIGDSMLWIAPILNTLIYGPLDNFKLVKQIGSKASYLYQQQLNNKLFAQPLNPEQIAEQIENGKFFEKFKFQNYEPNPMTKGNLIRLFKHNVIGSDAMSLAFFKIFQDKLMQYTSGEYQNYNNIVAGSLSGAFMAFLMNPIDCFKTLYVATDLKVQHSINNIHMRFSVGLSASILSSTIYRGMQFSLYEHFKRTTYMKKYNITEESYEKHTNYQNFNSYNNYLSLGQKYVAALSASLISSVVAYPLDTARKVLYTNIYIEDKSQHLKSISEALFVNKGMYGGFKYNCIKQIFQPITFILWDHAASQFCNKSNSHNYLY